MADCVITVELGFGADTKATAGYIMVRRVAEGRAGGALVLEDYRQYDFRSDEPLKITVEQGVVYESIEMRPRGRRRLWQAPSAETAVYSELTWLSVVPDGSGTYVVEPTVTDFSDATGEPDLDAGDYWVATNPDHPDYGYLMQKGS